MAAYPFWGMVAETTGRLLRLQGTVGAAQVQRRLRETLGERETVARAARRVLRAFMDWGVLEETVCKGVYSRAALRHVVDKRLAIWLIEASLRARGNKSAVLRTILDNPALFPFEVAPPSAQDVASTRRLEIVRHDNDEGLVLLKDENSKGNPGG
jgi:hypothetical protein